MSGVLLSQKATNRIIFFDQLLIYLSSLREKLGYTLSELPSLLKSEQKMINPILSAMSDKLMELGIKDSAKAAVASIPASFGLNGSDKKLVYDFFSSLGSTDCDGQLAHCDLYISLVEKLVNTQREESAKKSKLYRLLGIFCGIGAGLFFI